MTDENTNPSDATTCPSCGCAMAADVPAGLCPKCLLQQGFSDSMEAETQEDARGGRPIEGMTWLGSETPHRSGRFTPPSPEELAAHFPQLEIIELLGQGGMGAVYKARQRDLDRMIALKILPSDAGDENTFGQRFAREAKALAKLNHANIVMVHEFGRTEAGFYFFIMEYVDGLNLRQLLRDHKLDPAEALAIVPQICDALQFAHEEGVVHRDIKPENILIDKKGRVKIADFGLAKLMSLSPEDITLTREGGTMGTPQYMAPEQLEGAKHVDHRADIYSLGVVFYELLTGELPLGRFDPPSQRVQVDVRLDEVVMRTLEKEPDRRYQHASELKTQVESIEGLSPQQLDGVKRAMGREYKSKATLFGWPLLHVATGIDPKTGKHRVAKGVIALGDVAIGGIACGGMAFGGLAFGGFAIGLLGWGGIALGLILATGGVAVGAVAFGGVAIGGIAIGGMAIGIYSGGGAAWGIHAVGSESGDAQAREFFAGWAQNWPNWMAFIGLATPVLIGLMFLIQWLALRSGSSTSGWERKSNQAELGTSSRSVDRQHRSANDEDKSGLVCAVIAVIVFVLGLIVPAILFAVVDDRHQVEAVGLSFGIGMSLAFVFGLLGHRYRMGRFTALAALVVGGGLIMFQWLRTSSPSVPPRDGPDRWRTYPLDAGKKTELDKRAKLERSPDLRELESK